MKAIVYREYGSPDRLRLEEVEKPVPEDDEVLIRVHAVSLNGTDWENLTGKPLYARLGGLRKPIEGILGSDIAGRVEQVGRNASQFRPGDEVFGETLRYKGGLAEYVSVPERGLVRKPAGLTFEEAAAIPQGGVIALQAMRDRGQVQPGQQVLINGAGGSAGMFAVQLAKSYGAEVTGVDNAGKLEFLRSLGADHVIDYARQDFTRNRDQYDLILDVFARRSPFAYARALKPGGSYYAVGGFTAPFGQILLLGPWIRRSTGKNIRILVVHPNQKDLLTVAELCETGQLHPIIDRRYPLSEAAEALRRLGEGRARGKVIVSVQQNSETDRQF